MDRKLKVYLDTSIISHLMQEDVPEKMADTRKLWKMFQSVNNWLHKYLYKREYPDSVGRMLRSEYEHGKILSEQQFEEVLSHVLSYSKRI